MVAKKRDFSARPKVYRMTVHLFGGVWSPTCASFALLRTLSKTKLADVKENFYVDGLLISVENEAMAIHQAKQLKDEQPPSYCDPGRCHRTRSFNP